MGVGRTNAWATEASAGEDPWPAQPPTSPPMAGAAPPRSRPTPPPSPPQRSTAKVVVGVVTAFVAGLATMAVLRDPAPQVVDHASVVESWYADAEPSAEGEAEAPPVAEAEEEFEAILDSAETASDTQWLEIDPRVGDPLTVSSRSTIPAPGVRTPSIATIGDVTFVLASLNGEEGWGEPHVWRSRDGAAWEALGPVEPGASIFGDVVSDGSRLILGGSTAEGSAAIWTSLDGETWTREIVQEGELEPGFLRSAGGIAASDDGRMLVGVGLGLDMAWFRAQVPDHLRHLYVWFDDDYEHLELSGPFGLVVDRIPVADLGASAQALRAWDQADRDMDPPDRYLQTTPSGAWKPLDPDDGPAGAAWDPVRRVFFSIGASGPSLISSDGETWVRSAELHTRRPERWRGLSVAKTNEGELMVAGLDPGAAVRIDLDPIMGAVDRWSLHRVAAGEAGMAITIGSFTRRDSAVPVRVDVPGGTLVFDGEANELQVIAGSRMLTFDSTALDAPASMVGVDADTLTVTFPNTDTEALLEVDLEVLTELFDKYQEQVFDGRWRAFATSDGDLWQEAVPDIDFGSASTIHVDDQELIVVDVAEGVDGSPRDELAVVTFELEDAGLVPVTEPKGDELQDLLRRSLENHPEFWDQRWTDFDVTASRASWGAHQGADLLASIEVVDLIDLGGVPHMITETGGPRPDASDRVLWRWTGSEWSELGVAVPAGYWWASWPATSGSTIVVGATAPNGDAVIRRSTDGVVWTEQTVARAPEPGLRQTVWGVATDGERTVATVATTSSSGTWTPPVVADLGDDLRWRWNRSTARVEVVGPYQFTLASFSAEEAGLSAAVVAHLDGDWGEDQLHLQSDPRGEFQQVAVEGPTSFAHLEFDLLLERFVIRDGGGDGWESADGRSWAVRDYYPVRSDGHWQDMSVGHSGNLLTLSSVDGELTFRTNLSDMFGQVSGWSTEDVVAGHDHLAVIGQTYVTAAEPAERPSPPAVEVGEVTLSQLGDVLRIDIGSDPYAVPINGASGGDADLDFDLATRTATVRERATGAEVAEVPIEALAELERAGWGPQPGTAQVVFVSDDALEWNRVTWTQGAEPRTSAAVVGDLLVIVETSLREPGAAADDRVVRTWTLEFD